MNLLHFFFACNLNINRIARDWEWSTGMKTWNGRETWVRKSGDSDKFCLSKYRKVVGIYWIGSESSRVEDNF